MIALRAQIMRLYVLEGLLARVAVVLCSARRWEGDEPVPIELHHQPLVGDRCLIREGMIICGAPLEVPSLLRQVPAYQMVDNYVLAPQLFRQEERLPWPISNLAFGRAYQGIPKRWLPRLAKMGLI